MSTSSCGDSRTRFDAFCCNYYDDVPETIELFVVCRNAAQIGRQLAYIGDTINERHAPQFNQMIRLMNLTPETAYEAFAGIARK
jgi:hypothetical protein